MPWKTQGDVSRHNKAAGKSKRKGKLWRKVANNALARGLSEGASIREANAVSGGFAHHRDRSSEGRAKRMYGGKHA